MSRDSVERLSRPAPRLAGRHLVPRAPEPEALALEDDDLDGADETGVRRSDLDDTRAKDRLAAPGSGGMQPTSAAMGLDPAEPLELFERAERAAVRGLVSGHRASARPGPSSRSGPQDDRIRLQCVEQFRDGPCEIDGLCGRDHRVQPELLRDRALEDDVRLMDDEPQALVARERAVLVPSVHVERRLRHPAFSDCQKTLSQQRSREPTTAPLDAGRRCSRSTR